VAVAFWTQGGSGSGSAATGTTTTVTVNQTSVVTGLYPGDSPVGLSGDYTNPNAGAVKVGTVTAVIDPTFSVQTDPSKPACTPADFAIAGSATPTNVQIPSGTHVGSWSGLTIAMNNLATNQDNCKSLASVPINYTVTAGS
jgi:hypothetical protein